MVPGKLYRVIAKYGIICVEEAQVMQVMEEPLEFRIEQIIYSKDTIFLYVEQVFPFAKQSEKWKGYSNAPDALMTYSKILLDDKILLTYDEHYLEELIEEIKLNG